MLCSLQIRLVTALAWAVAMPSHISLRAHFAKGQSLHTSSRRCDSTSAAHLQIISIHQSRPAPLEAPVIFQSCC
eukprot:352112-Chlamydomonas_euryale.AAC.2